MEISMNEQYHDEKARIQQRNTDTKEKRDPTYIRITSKKVILLLDWISIGNESSFLHFRNSHRWHAFTTRALQVWTFQIGDRIE